MMLPLLFYDYVTDAWLLKSTEILWSVKIQTRICFSLKDLVSFSVLNQSVNYNETFTSQDNKCKDDTLQI